MPSELLPLIHLSKHCLTDLSSKLSLLAHSELSTLLNLPFVIVKVNIVNASWLSSNELSRCTRLLHNASSP